MKKLKLILGCLFVAATLFSAVACKQSLNSFLGGDDSDDQADSDTIPVGNYITGTASNAKVDESNVSGNKRNLIPFKTKHYGSRAKIVQTDLNANKANGVMGYAFNVVYHEAGDEKETGGTYSANTADFCLVSVTYAGSPIYYISSYRNITDFQDTNFGVAKSKVFKTGSEQQFLACEDPCEYELVALPGLISGSDIDGKRNGNLTKYAYDDDEKTLTVAINVTANNDGSYTIDFYDPEDVIKSSGSWISSTKLAAITNKLTQTLPASATGYSTKKQTYLGVYANIYPGHTLKGNWRLSGIKGEAEVEEFED